MNPMWREAGCREPCSSLRNAVGEKAYERVGSGGAERFHHVMIDEPYFYY
jgi:hypothetical protein